MARLIPTIFCILLLISCKSKDLSLEKPTGTEKVYENPVINYSLPDPSIIKAKDGYFYLYATEDIRNTPIHRSKDLINWEASWDSLFTNETRPNL